MSPVFLNIISVSTLLIFHNILNIGYWNKLFSKQPPFLHPTVLLILMTMPSPCTVGAAWAHLPGRPWSSPRCGRGTGWPALHCRHRGMWPGRWRGGLAHRLPRPSGLAAVRCPSHRRRTWSLSPRRTGRRTRGSPLSRHSTALWRKDKERKRYEVSILQSHEIGAQLTLLLSHTKQTRKLVSTHIHTPCPPERQCEQLQPLKVK